VHNFIQIGSVRGPKTCFGVETENGQAYAYAWPSVPAGGLIMYAVFMAFYSSLRDGCCYVGRRHAVCKCNFM